ncbi:Cj0814 family flagellar-dependent secreted protein [Campylobacter jejuni]|uniref:Cj0814 family flagellar-dependent secreted protein n=4 Tax=Campylobacter jejuni TaxID=197 RepID=UPI003DA7A729
MSSEFKNSIYTLKYKQADISNNTAYGYSVDKDGYMGSDFNKAAGLPEDFKIHKSTLDEIKKAAENDPVVSSTKEYLGVSEYYTNIDMAETIKQYYNQFNQIVNYAFNDTNKTSFTEADINSIDFKIHKSTLDEIKKAAENDPVVSSTKEYLGVSEYYTNIDMAETIKQYYNQFNQIVNYAFNDTNKTSFTEADINSIPKGISELSSDKTIGIMPKNYDKLTITNYYNTQEQYNEAEQLGMFGHINIGLQPLNFTPQSMQTQNLDKDTAIDTFNPDMSVYPQNEDGSYSKEALFMSFLKSTGVSPREGSATLNPIAKSYAEAMAKESFDESLTSLDDIMTGKVDFASLLKSYAQDGWLDADIYVMDKGVKWQNTSIGYGGAWFDNQFNQAKANGWKASSESINSFADSIADRLNNLIGQTRV